MEVDILEEVNKSNVEKTVGNEKNCETNRQMHEWLRAMNQVMLRNPRLPS